MPDIMPYGPLDVCLFTLIFLQADAAQIILTRGWNATQKGRYLYAAIDALADKRGCCSCPDIMLLSTSLLQLGTDSLLLLPYLTVEGG